MNPHRRTSRRNHPGRTLMDAATLLTRLAVMRIGLGRVGLTRVVFVAVVLIAAWGPLARFAGADDELPPMVADSVWYDADAQELLPASIAEPSVDAGNRDSRWLARPKPPATTSSWNWNWPNWNLGRLIGWAVLIGLLIALVTMLLWAFQQSEFDLTDGSTRKRGSLAGTSLDVRTQQRMSQLPAELRGTRRDPKEMAIELMRAGNFDAALVCLFGHQLLLLDRAGWLRLTRGKTNGQYVRETRPKNANAAEILRSTVAAFERSYFGRHAITQDQFERLWERNTELESLVSQGELVAA